MGAVVGVGHDLVDELPPAVELQRGEGRVRVVAEVAAVELRDVGGDGLALAARQRAVAPQQHLGQVVQRLGRLRSEHHPRQDPRRVRQCDVRHRASPTRWLSEECRGAVSDCAGEPGPRLAAVVDAQGPQDAAGGAVPPTPDEPIEVSPPSRHAAGVAGAAAGASAAVSQMGVARSVRTLLKVNQTDGFDCPGCAWPEPGRRSHLEFCENGAKAVAEEATRRVSTPQFFATHSLDGPARPGRALARPAGSAHRADGAATWQRRTTSRSAGTMRSG